VRPYLLRPTSGIISSGLFARGLVVVPRHMELSQHSYTLECVQRASWSTKNLEKSLPEAPPAFRY
jgi:hypothetical protein